MANKYLDLNKFHQNPNSYRGVKIKQTNTEAFALFVCITSPAPSVCTQAPLFEARPASLFTIV